MIWASPPLYHRTPGGTLKVWQIVSDKNYYYTRTGDVGSTLRESKPTMCSPKNVGSSNERDAETVAKDTAESKYASKLAGGYVDSLDKIEEQDKIPRAMLARPDTAKEMPNILKAAAKGKVLVQPKLDGFRCLADARGLWSRELRVFDTVPHIKRALAPLFEKHPDLVLDGELYNHGLRDDFSKIQSLLTTKSANMLDVMESEDIIQFHVYDSVKEEPFTPRFIEAMKLVNELDSPHVKLVETVRVWDEDGIHKKNQKFVDQGYEGTMIRISGPNYEQGKRPRQLVKLKQFEDEEFVVVDIIEGKGGWAGHAKSITCLVPNSGVLFNAGCKGTMPTLKKLLEDKEEYLGGKATIEFFGKFPTGRPRFPIAAKYFKR